MEIISLNYRPKLCSKFHFPASHTSRRGLRQVGPGPRPMKTCSLLLLGLRDGLRQSSPGLCGGAAFPFGSSSRLHPCLSFGHEISRVLGCRRAQVRRIGLFVIWNETIENLYIIHQNGKKLHVWVGPWEPELQWVPLSSLPLSPGSVVFPSPSPSVLPSVNGHRFRGPRSGLRCRPLAGTFQNKFWQAWRSARLFRW